MAASEPQSRLGPLVGRYRVVGRLGKGGMGMVYRALDEALEREVAVKTLTVEGTLDEESRKRFEIEAKAAARMQHPNIVTVFELGQNRGLPFIAMELLPGMDFEALLRSGEALLLHEKLEIVVQVLRGLAFAHERGIVHRDMKPSNIRLLESGTAKIMDFGIAKLGQSGVTKTGMMVGTVYYMSPEQIRGRPLDGRSDVFSVGVMLHEVLDGKRPFTGQDAPEILYKIVNDPPPRLSADLGDFREPLQALLDRALAKNPEQRVSSAGRFADDLSAILSEFALQTPGEVLEQIQAARRLSREGRAAEAVEQLRELAESYPNSVEARRTLRFSGRDLLSLHSRSSSESDAFPELEATFAQPGVETSRQPNTLTGPRPESTSGEPAAGGAGRGLWLAAGAGLLLAITAGWFLFLGSRRPPAPGPTPISTAVAPPASSPGGPVSSEEAIEEASADEKPISPTSSAVSSHPGSKPAASSKRSSSSEKASEPSAPPGSLRVSSPYPVDVIFQGRALSRAQASARIDLPSGRQTVTLVSDALLLRMSSTVEIRAGGESSLSVPAPGKLNINANPDNCEIFVDGVFLDYPPILGKPVASGTHQVAFKWPDGKRREETVEVSAGGTAYLTGRKD